MIAFEVKDMTCGHCVATISQAVKGADKDASVRIDLASHRVEIEPGSADAAKLSGVIRAAGYTPLAVEHASAGSAPARSAQRRGCCCG